jgi:tRNA A-37 threonylcarbamoyl transferase component Bud32
LNKHKVADENRYDIIQELGRGAMGIVYKAIDRETSECIAIKVLKPEVLDDKLMMQRFKNEMRIARKITHKNVCRIHEFTHVPQGPCITMEYVDGETIRSLLNRIGVFSLRSAFDVARQMCSGLREAHAQGVAHRDLKPENLMMDRNGNIKIMDFGVARVFATSTSTTLGSFVGTPAYMAPEQVECRDVDQRADVYAFGLILYEMLTGGTVFKADTPLRVAYKQVHEAPPAPRTIDPNIPEAVQSLILRCIEKEPERRFQTIADVESAMAGLGYRPPTTVDVPVAGVPRRHSTTYIMARKRARLLMLAVQLLYYCIYGAALYYLDEIGRIVETVFQVSATIAISVVVVLAMCGIATRVYLTSALIFEHPDLSRKFRNLFPALWLLDSIWATSPLLLFNKMGFVTLGCVALLAYVPFSQKTLMENLSPENPRLER